MKQAVRLNNWLIIFALVSSTAFAQERHELSAKQAVDYGLKNSRQVQNALIGINLQKEMNREITADAFPQISGNINVNDYLSIPTNLLPGEFFGQPAGTYIPVKFGTKYNASYGATLQQTLFDGRVLVGLQARKSSIDYAQATAEITQEQIKGNIYKIYYQLLVGKLLITTIDANITSTEKLLNDTREIYKNGFAEKLDVNKVEVTLANLKTEKEKAQSRINVGWLGLKLLMGMPGKDQLILTDTLSEQDVQLDLLDQPYNYSDRKEFRQLQSLERLRTYNLKRYKLAYFPTVSLSASYIRNAQRNKFDFFKSGEPWFTTSVIGINISVPIFDGFARDARIKQAQLQLKQIQNNLEDYKMLIDFEVDSSRSTMRSAIAAMQFQRQNRQLAEDVYDQTRKKYESGLGSNLEVTNAQAQQIIAQNNYYNALADAIVAKIDYLKASGKL